jgi:hypothetical protein
MTGIRFAQRRILFVHDFLTQLANWRMATQSSRTKEYDPRPLCRNSVKYTLGMSLH